MKARFASMTKDEIEAEFVQKEKEAKEREEKKKLMEWEAENSTANGLHIPVYEAEPLQYIQEKPPRPLGEPREKDTISSLLPERPAEILSEEERKEKSVFVWFGSSAGKGQKAI